MVRDFWRHPTICLANVAQTLAATMIRALQEVILETSVCLQAAIAHSTVANAMSRVGLGFQEERLAANVKIHVSLEILAKLAEEQGTYAHKFQALAISTCANAMPQDGSLLIKHNRVNNAQTLVKILLTLASLPKILQINALSCLLNTPHLVRVLCVNAEGMGFCLLQALDLALNAKTLVIMAIPALRVLLRAISAFLLKVESVDCTLANADSPDGLRHLEQSRVKLVLTLARMTLAFQGLVATSVFRFRILVASTLVNVVHLVG